MSHYTWHNVTESSRITANFQVKKKRFFKNFSIIFLFGVVGTLISFCVISTGVFLLFKRICITLLKIQDYLALGAIFSATDSVCTLQVKRNNIFIWSGRHTAIVCFISTRVFLLFKRIGITSLKIQDYLALGAIFSATDSVCTLQVLNQDQVPLLYSLVFGEGVVNDATSIVLFNAVQTINFSDISAATVFALLGTFLYLLITSTLLGLAGLASGAVVLLVTRGGNSHILVFSEDLFFIYLLPPIIFNAGFQVKKKRFFKNFSIIFLFGVVGTLISFCVISTGVFLLFKRIGITSLKIQDYLALGAIFSATDSVCTLQVLNQDQVPLLYSLVFGEGVVNDATSIVLFNAVQTINFSDVSAATVFALLGTFLYLLITSTLLGLAVGLLSAYLIKTLYFGRHSTDREVAIMLLLAYLSYMVSELLSLSGILTVFFCGIVMSHYTWHNVTESSRITAKHAFATISFIAETFIFLYVGMDALDLQKWRASHANFQTSVSVSFTLCALVLVGRAAFVFPLAYIANYGRRTRTKVVFRQQFIIWWAGLMRGAVTIALSYNQFTDFGSTPADQARALMVTSTIIVVLFSTLVFGSITKPLIEALLFGRPKPDASQPQSLDDILVLFLENGGPIDESGYPVPPRGSNLSLLMKYPTSTVHYFWRKFDDKYMRPVFGGRGFVPFVPGSPTEPQDEPS